MNTAVQSTRALGGRRIRVARRAWWWVLAIVGPAAPAYGAACASGTSGWWWPWGMGVFVAGALQAARLTRLAREFVDACSAAANGDDAGSEVRLARLITAQWCPTDLAAPALLGLAESASNRGERSDASLLARAAVGLVSRSGGVAIARATAASFYTHGAIFLAHAGALDEAERALAAAGGEQGPHTAVRALGHAYVALLRGRGDDALRALDEERVLLCHALTGRHAALAAAIDRAARMGASGAYRERATALFGDLDFSEAANAWAALMLEAVGA